MIKKINAIVTGGSSGLGEATVRKILESGGNVSILDTQEDVEAMREQLDKIDERLYDLQKK